MTYSKLNADATVAEQWFTSKLDENPYLKTGVRV